MVLQFRNTSVPSLTRIAALKTTTLLWNRVYSSANYIDERYPMLYIWQDLNVKENVRYLKLPKFLEEEILCLVDFIGLDIRRWLSCMCTNEIRSLTALRVKIFWTQTGTINNRKTAEVLVKDKRFAAYIRYEIACIFCLEEDCKRLWKEMNEKQRNKYSNFSYSIRPEVIYWTHITTGHVTGLNDIYIRGFGMCTHSHFAFVESARRCNLVATQYFFAKLTSKERKESLVIIAREVAENRRFKESEYSTDVLFFLLSQMDDEEQERVFADCTAAIIKGLTAWHRGNLLPDALNQIWQFINNDVFYDVLESIAVKQDPNCEKCVNRYRQLFSDVWQRAPVPFKSDFINETLTKYSLLWTLLRKDVLTNIKLILKDATEGKKEFLSSNIGNFICNRFLDDENWCALELIVKACVTSKREVTDFQRKFRRNGILEEAERGEKIMETFREVLSKVENEIEQDTL